MNVWWWLPNPMAPALLDVTYDTTRRYVPEQPLYGKALKWGPKDPKTLHDAILKATGKMPSFVFLPQGRYQRLRFEFRSMKQVSQASKRLQKIRDQYYDVTWGLVAKSDVIRRGAA
jgi:hypothetical protein